MTRRNDEIFSVINTVIEFKGNVKWNVIFRSTGEKDILTISPMGFDKYTDQGDYDSKYMKDNYPILHKMIKEDRAKIDELLSKLEVAKFIRNVPVELEK